ncbi:MAG: phosphatidylglycerophosphatase A [Pseudomonadota bacterium]
MTAAGFIATVGGIGRLPMAPGTWGSLAALPAALALHGLGGFPALAIATGVVFAIGLWAVGAAGPAPDPDRPEFVVDEVVGQWIAIFPMSLAFWYRDGAPGTLPWPAWVFPFLAFRFFDIVKPPPVSWADRLKTPLGVMLDDVVAGVMAGLLCLLLAIAYHGLVIL